jgi:hypothetical protein
VGDDHHLDVGWNYANNVYPVGPVDQHDPNDNLWLNHHPDHDDPEAEAQAVPSEEESP